MKFGSNDSLAGSADSRIIYVNDAAKNQQQKYLHNRISTAKYNLFTFIPKFLFEQFSKTANMFFLFIACIQVSFHALNATLMWLFLSG